MVGRCHLNPRTVWIDEFFDRSGVAFLVVSSKGKFEAANRPFCQMLGCSEEELLGRFVDEVTVSNQPLMRSRAIQRLARSLGRQLKQGVATQRERSGGPIASMPKIAGFNVDDGVARVGGNLDFFLEVVRQFAKNYRFTGEELGQAVADGRIALATSKAHKLKGVAKNIGANRLGAVAENLEQTLRSGLSGDLEEWVLEVTDELRVVCEGVDELPPVSPPGKGTRIGDDELVERLEHIAGLLAEDDTDAATELELLRGRSLPENISRELKKMAESLGKFDFRGALRVANTLIRKSS
jgi:PAS domain S-box-containing protein